MSVTSQPSQPSQPPAPSQKYQVNTATRVFEVGKTRILCVADIRGRLSHFNALAAQHNAAAIIHTGDFGFYDADSLPRVTDRTLKHLAQYSPLLSQTQRTRLLDPSVDPGTLRSELSISTLSEFPLLLSGQFSLSVPIYTVWGACEDVRVLEKIRVAEYKIPNLEILDEATTRMLDVGGVKLRLLGLGGALVPHKMFDNGDGQATIAGGGGTMWTTLLQIGELVDTAQRVYDPTETRLFISHASPGREGLMAQLALVVKADLTMSGGLHFRYSTSHNEFSTQADFEGYKRKLALSKEAIDKVWTSVKPQVEAVIDEHQSVLLDKALSVIDKVPSTTSGNGNEDPAWKNCWNWNLCDAAYGQLVLDVKDGRVSAELKSQGFNYAYRRSAQTNPSVSAANASTPKPVTPKPPSGKATPAPAQPPPPATAPAAISTGGTKPATPAPPAPQSGKDTPAKAASPAPVENKDGGGGGEKPASTRAEKEKAKKERKKAEKKAAAEEKKSGTVTPASDLVKSPLTETRSPKENKGDAFPSASPPPHKEGGTARPARNPHTLFFRLPQSAAGASEAQVRALFGEDHSKTITKMTFPNSFLGRAKKVCFIEFGNAEDVAKALAAVEGKTIETGEGAERQENVIPEVKMASVDERPDRGGSGDRGGRGRGRGGRGGGFASRGLAAAGLTANHNNGGGNKKEGH